MLTNLRIYRQILKNFARLSAYSFSSSHDAAILAMASDLVLSTYRPEQKKSPDGPGMRIDYL